MNKILLLGSGALRIGQAGEFDYSGSQALKALRDENKWSVLINPNIATVQTDPGMADVIYNQPLTVDAVSAIIKQERPDGILLGFGGQTALNLGLTLAKNGLLDAYQVKVLGTSIDAIMQTEDRQLFKEALHSIQVKTPQSKEVSSIAGALEAADQLGYPVMVRCGFALGGLGSGLAIDANMLRKKAREIFSFTSQFLVEEYLLGWKEFEYEIIRDVDGRALAVCNMENLDPMGIHTGDSVVIAPAQTLTNTQHQALRNIAFNIAEHFNIIGECNIQYAINPHNGDYRVIELNARLSRSSALASKATGYPLAYIATQLALGKKLYELQNKVTHKTCAYFEPALDYVVIKIPRWDTQKLRLADRQINTEMKSVGEVMGIGRNFAEALQKAISMLNIGASCLADPPFLIEDHAVAIQFPTDQRLFALYQFFKSGGSIEQAHQLSHIDKWFLHQIYRISEHEQALRLSVNSESLSKSQWLSLKQAGFSDYYIASVFHQTEEWARQGRLSHGIRPYVKQIDTTAGEIEAKTNYLYMTYHASEHDIPPSELAPVIVLGSGPYSIGSSVEFDWCAVNTLRTLRKLGEYTLLINSNPETVSTDYDESDRLYFETLTLERVRDITDFEKPKGVIVSVGGQIANNIAWPLSQSGCPILGTSAESIEIAESRSRFADLLRLLDIKQPDWQCVKNANEAKKFVDLVGYPVIIRPSHVLSGALMRVVNDDESLIFCIGKIVQLSKSSSILVSKFIDQAREFEIDAVAHQGEIIAEAIFEHVENAGVHSGDATLIFPTQYLSEQAILQAKVIASQMAAALSVTGLFNAQFLIKNDDIYVIECNLRASRSLPFLSKSIGRNFVALATETVMQGQVEKRGKMVYEVNQISIKMPQFSYERLRGADPLTHVEMSSTGEVACTGHNLLETFWRAWLATEKKIHKNALLLRLSSDEHVHLLPWLKTLDKNGWAIFANEETVAYLHDHDITVNLIDNEAEMLAHKDIGLVIAIPKAKASESTDYALRRLAIDCFIPLITNAQVAEMILKCLASHAQPVTENKVYHAYDVLELAHWLSPWEHQLEF